MNTQLERVDGVTSSAQAVAANARALSSLFTATLGGPLVKTAALSYGLRKASQARKLKNDAAALEAVHARASGAPAHEATVLGRRRRRRSASAPPAR